MRLLSADRLSIDELARVYNESRADYMVPMPMSPARLGEYMRLYDVDPSASWVAVDGDDYVGLGMLGIRENRAWITRIGVLPEARRHGAGAAITDGLLASAESLGLSTVWLEVIVGNEPAHKLFRKRRFEETRELVVARRPPQFGSNSSNPPQVARVESIDRDAALALLSARPERPNWLNETESMSNVIGLQGLVIHFANGTSGWVTFRADQMMLTHVYTGVTRGEVEVVSQALLEVLHGDHRRLDAYVENLSAHGSLWRGFEGAGYFDTFRRIEMVRRF